MNREEWWASGFAPPVYRNGPVSRTDHFDSALVTVLKVMGIMLILPFWALAVFLRTFVRINL